MALLPALLDATYAERGTIRVHLHAAHSGNPLSMS